MKYFYTFFIIFFVLVSCADFKTDSALGELNRKAELYNSYKISNLKSEFEILERTSNLDDSFKNKYDLVTSVKNISEDYFNYLDSLKSLVKTHNPTSSKEAELNLLQKEFFNKKEITKAGHQFIEMMERFKSELTPYLEEDYLSTKEALDSLFNTGPVTVLNSGKETYLSFMFKGVSNATAIANLTLIQSNIVAIQTRLMSKIMGDQQLSTNAYKVDVALEKSKYYPGDKVRGKLIINKSTENLIAKDVILNGKNIDEKFIKDGEVEIVFNAPKKVGDYPVEGELTISQGKLDFTLYFNKLYKVVAKPKARARNKKRNNKKANIEIKPKKNFANIGSLARPEISIRGKQATRGTIKIAKSSFRLATIDVVIPDSDFEGEVTEFNFKPSNQPTIKIYGNKLTLKAISVLNKSKRGRKFKIFNVKARLKGKKTYRLKTPITINVEIVD
ncbi:MAG: hypothetical protein L3J45_08885 [Flavobacteriaceae bacterium]|nr:hypothetical protein [Flavobacteriaceae bacterium]